MDKKISPHYDIAVIGAGPAGLMAAAEAARHGCAVIILEKNSDVGRKLLITGNGRCNITNAEKDINRLVEKYGREGRFLYSGLNRFGPAETVEFFNSIGLDTKEERGKRIFPVSDKAAEVLDKLLSFLADHNVNICTSTPVTSLNLKDNRIDKLQVNDSFIMAEKYIVCTGGKSYPSTGSTGDGYRWAENVGHSIVNPAPAIVPLKVKEDWVRDLMGLSLKNVTLTAFAGKKKIASRFGEMLFTHFGISGPIVMDASHEILDGQKKNRVKILIDLKPALDEEKLDNRLQRDFLKYKGRIIENSLKDLLPAALIPVILKLSSVESTVVVDQLKKEDRKKIVQTIKGLPLEVTGSLGFNWAIVTRGGVKLSEVDPATMRSKFIDNLFFAGEILNLQGPTGGFNLQVCWTTGFLAGNAAAEEIC